MAVRTDALRTAELQQYAGDTEHAGCEFRLNGIDRSWKDYCGWITFAQNKKRWNKLVARFTNLHNGMSPNMSRQRNSTRAARTHTLMATNYMNGPPAMALLMMFMMPVLTTMLIGWYYSH